MSKENKYCSNCTHNTLIRRPNNIEFTCSNPYSEYYGVPTAFDDTCDDYEEKEE